MTVKTQNELHQEHIDTLTRVSGIFETQNELNETSRETMEAQSMQTGESILNMMTPIFGPHAIYVDGGAAEGGVGTSDSPFKTYGDAIRSIPSNRPTIIHLKTGHEYNFGEIDSSYDFVEIFSPSITTMRWGPTTADADPVLNAEHLIHSNGYIYPKTGLVFKRPSTFQLVNVNLKVNAPEGYTDQPSSGLSTIYPHFGASLAVSVSYSDIEIAEGMSFVSPYFTCPNLSVLTYNGSMSGGGNLVSNQHGVPISVSVPVAMAIADDTYVLDRVYSGQNLNVTSAYQGSQLARS